LGFLGLFGFLMALAEAIWVFKEVEPVVFTLEQANLTDKFLLNGNLLLFAGVNFLSYSTIPLYIAKCGATLFNLSNVTTVLWGMLCDIVLFQKDFYWLYTLAFALEMVGVLLFSSREPARSRPPQGQSIQEIVESRS
jgi:solute carrier family 35 protein F1/2